MVNNMNLNEKKLLEESDLLEDSTLIIPTFNRPQHLARLVRYYAKKKTSVRFLILDSSEAQTKEHNKKIAALLTHCQYVEFPSEMPVAKKLFEGLKLVETTYCAFCADDDLVFMSSLSSALSFLKNHPDYVCVDGIYLNFNQAQNNVHIHIEYATRGIQADDAGARVFKLYQKYESLFYGVFRTKDALSIFSHVSKNASLHYQELFQSTAALLIGKSHRLPIFYAARQSCAPADEQRNKWQTYYWFADNPNEFFEHYLIYREELWNFYQNQVTEKKYTQTRFLQVMDIAHAMYFGLGCPPEYFHSVLQSHWPSDSFKKAKLFSENVCNQLKSKRRVWWEGTIENIGTWLPKILLSSYSIYDVYKLNREVQKKTNMPWKGMLHRNIKWLASVDHFQKTYLELCWYLGA